MKKTIVTLAMCLAATVYAHDEGHGPKLADTGKFGGLVSSVVSKTDIKKGAGAVLVHKAELVRSTDGNVRIYLYDAQMKPLDLKGFEAKSSANLGSKVKGKWKDSTFPIELKDNSFTGKMPKVESRPYNIEVTLKQDGKELISAFENLD